MLTADTLELIPLVLELVEGFELLEIDLKDLTDLPFSYFLPYLAKCDFELTIFALPVAIRSLPFRHLTSVALDLNPLAIIRYF